ncbi:MAG: tRNA (adenosine(37)-N6)-threonylcarbamoyltransferase complex dimerization subunit type 1 TsaB [Elusimicrobia bacterium]|nr:tRNA (adenosine(37)-N6)-threonylcarbamoyltransferase complex dimerization subunit type 1 TsaB [Elusimicrobiota bacterium]
MAKKKKIILGLSTAGSRVKIALKNGIGEFTAKSIKEPNQEKVFFKIIEKLLSFEKAELKDIGGICAIKGPGRFTGIRISLTFASMMKALTGIKVFTVTAFEVLAFQVVESLVFKKWAEKAKNPKIVAILHAFKKEYFLQVFTQNMSGLPESLSKPEWLEEGDIRKRIADIKGDVYVIADTEEDEDIYRLADKKNEKAPLKISKIMPENIIKTALIKKDEDISPLYLKPARYELMGK